MTSFLFLVIYDRHLHRKGKKKFGLANFLPAEWSTMNL